MVKSPSATLVKTNSISVNASCVFDNKSLIALAASPISSFDLTSIRFEKSPFFAISLATRANVWIGVTTPL